MEPISWEIIASLTVQYGLPFAEKMWKKSTSGVPPTQDDFNELKDLASHKAIDEAKAVITGLGLSLDDPKAVAILALVS